MHSGTNGYGIFSGVEIKTIFPIVDLDLIIVYFVYSNVDMGDGSHICTVLVFMLNI